MTLISHINPSETSVQDLHQFLSSRPVSSELPSETARQRQLDDAATEPCLPAATRMKVPMGQPASGSDSVSPRPPAAPRPPTTPNSTRVLPSTTINAPPGSGPRSTTTHHATSVVTVKKSKDVTRRLLRMGMSTALAQCPESDKCEVHEFTPNGHWNSTQQLT